eukprot:GHVL01012260.1.p1 GENE.GHVL01012260.1~~GHVL01012260.1.p1  ORF type:complete len:300 (-),score=77.70 GHVL01012260.1:98-997(-)
MGLWTQDALGEIYSEEQHPPIIDETDNETSLEGPLGGENVTDIITPPPPRGFDDIQQINETAHETDETDDPQFVLADEDETASLKFITDKLFETAANQEKIIHTLLAENEQLVESNTQQDLCLTNLNEQRDLMNAQIELLKQQYQQRNPCVDAATQTIKNDGFPQYTGSDDSKWMHLMDRMLNQQEHMLRIQDHLINNQRRVPMGSQMSDMPMGSRNPDTPMGPQISDPSNIVDNVTNLIHSMLSQVMLSNDNIGPVGVSRLSSDNQLKPVIYEPLNHQITTLTSSLSTTESSDNQFNQ